MDHMEVLQELQKKGISIRIASPKLMMEEAPEAYKVCPYFQLFPILLDLYYPYLITIVPFLFIVITSHLQDVHAVVETCHQAGISKKTVRLRPIAVIKG